MPSTTAVTDAQLPPAELRSNAVLESLEKPPFRLILVDLTDKNIAQVKLLNQLTFPVRYGDHFYEGLLKFKDNGGFVKLAYMCDVLVGSIGCRMMAVDPKDPSQGMKMYIMTLSVLPMFRRCRVATTLLNALQEDLEKRTEALRLEREAKARSASHHHGQHRAEETGLAGQVVKISLDVQINNASAISFYEKHGFEKVAEVPGYYPDLDPKDAYTMEKQLPVVEVASQARPLVVRFPVRPFATVGQLQAAGIVKNPEREREFARLRDGEERVDFEAAKRESLWMRAVGGNAGITRQEMYLDYVNSVKSLRSLLDYYDIAVPVEQEMDLKKSAASVGLSLPQVDDDTRQ
ncbi:N-alpha-acetyltransferase 50 [Perkinsus olseni]|uniref:N-alpha-acetyltransferase 50 n=1 Tax=Perkinsus olseni TaxID=32597 RepID=A0A7J6NUD4_PEROL|nr:N-alpha-acetyltransferase 50 [Perkinsus olseni]